MLKRYFIAGLLVWLPIFTTLYVVHLLLNLVKTLFDWLPDMLRPDFLLGYPIPGFEVMLALLLVLLSGVLATHFLGQWLLSIGENVLARIPLVRTVYSATKQVVETLLGSKGVSFNKVLLVEYPRKEVWSIAFQTNTGFQGGDTEDLQALITVFIPSVPSPLSGFLVMMAPSQVRELSMSVDEALKMIISLGMIKPQSSSNK